MDMEKCGSMENVSYVIETDCGAMIAQSDAENEDDNTGVGRFYDCNYCKRGFTNAQALGGNINIHRKNKARAQPQKQQQSNFYAPSSFSYGANDFYKSYYPNFANKKVSDAPVYCGTNNYYSRRRTRLFGMFEEHLRADLSFRVISSSIVDEFRHGEEKTKEGSCSGVLDLELRLGYGP